MTDDVILVDEQDQALGTMDKILAHVEGRLHRAFSVFIFNTEGQLLLQQRALGKYHSGGKWTNTCCSHPRPGEATLAAAHRRLEEEMGMQCELSYAFNFTYQAEVNEALSEHEFDHVFFGFSNDLPKINPEEVADFRYVNLDELAAALLNEPQQYTEWLRICFDQVLANYKKKITN